MDKDEFVYSVNGLRAAGSAGKTLYRCWTDVGQKLFSKKKVSFCTLAPVDMQAFFHSRCDFRVVLAGSEATNPTFVAGLTVLACMQDVAYLLEVAFADLISCRPKNACRAIACPAVASDVSLPGVCVVVSLFWKRKPNFVFLQTGQRLQASGFAISRRSRRDVFGAVYRNRVIPL